MNPVLSQLSGTEVQLAQVLRPKKAWPALAASYEREQAVSDLLQQVVTSSTAAYLLFWAACREPAQVPQPALCGVSATGDDRGGAP
jgi:hypothetical protein